MKKIICILLAVILCTFSTFTAYAETPSIKISQNSAEEVFDENHFGIDLTGAECGLSANLVKNGSFENDGRAWSAEGTQFALGDSDPVSEANKIYSVIAVQNSAVLKNQGYSEKKSIPVTEGERYKFTCCVKNVDFDGEVSVMLSSSKGNSNRIKLAEDTIGKKSWETLSTEITAPCDGMGELEIIFNGSGTLQLDNVSLVPMNSFGFGNEAWKFASLRDDTVQALKMLNPSFVMFCAQADAWPATVGKPSQRTDGAEIGCHEYLQLCRELNSKPIPAFDTDDFENSDTDNSVQGVIDLIEYANADSLTSYFGALRAGNGSEEAFGIEYIYLKGKGKALGKIQSAVEEKYENVTVLTDSEAESILSVTDYGKGKTKNNMGTAILSAKAMLESESGFVSYKNSVGFEGEEKDEPCMIRVSPGGISLSPEYYAQLMFSNNFGEQKIALPQIHEKITQTARLDSAKQILYVYLVNEGASRVVELAPDGFGNADYISVQSLSSAFKSTANIMGKQRIAPREEELESDGTGIKLELKSNSVTVLRIAYGGNTGSNFYTLPEELDLSTKLYIPPAFGIIAAVLAVSVPLGTVFGFILYKKILSKNKKDKRTSKEDE